MKTLIKNIKYFGKHVVNCNIFISYSSENSNEAFHVKNQVEKYGAIPFIAPESISAGEDFKKIIQSNIENCSLFIPIISSKTINSAYTHQEIGYALSLKKEIIPIIIDKVDNKDLAFISNIQYVEFGTEKLNSTIKKSIQKRYIKTISILIVLLLIFLFRAQIANLIS